MGREGRLGPRPCEELTLHGRAQHHYSYVIEVESDRSRRGAPELVPLIRFRTSRADTMNDHARENVPFSQNGERTVTVEVTSGVRPSELSFEVRVATDEAVSV